MSSVYVSYLKSQKSGRLEKQIPAKVSKDLNMPDSMKKPSLCPNRFNTLWTSRTALSQDSIDVTGSRGSVVSSAASKRHFYFFSRKHTKSFPSPETDTKKSEIFKLHRQFSHDMAMQNNCTVINNKVGPVVIKNCKEEFQMRQIKNKALGKLHETSTEHELLLDKYFLLKDQFVGIDRHDTLEKHGVPNMRKRFEGPTLYAVGQPTMNGLEKFSKTLLQNHKIVYYVNVRSVPTLFLRRSDDFLPYSAYYCTHSGQQKTELTESEIHDVEREMQSQALAIASTNSDVTFYYYNVLDPSPDEPHMYKTKCMEDLQTSRQIFAKILVEHKNFKYKRLPLNTLNKPSPEWINSLMEILKEANVFHNQDAAIVFQGLTGEATACLAMILTSLTMSSTISEKTLKKRAKVRSLQEHCLWRETIIKHVMESSKLEQTSRNEVDAVIASVVHGSLLEQVAKRISQESQEEGSGLQRELANDHNETNGENFHHHQIEEQMSFIPTTSGSLTLRDVSELCLPSNHRRKELRLGSAVRYEANDEESLIKNLLMNSDLYVLILIYRQYVNEQKHCDFHKMFSKWLNHHPKFIFDVAQMRQYNHSIDFSLPLELTVKFEDASDMLPGPAYHRVVGFPCFGMQQSFPKRFAETVKRLCHNRAKVPYNGVVFINCREELSFYSSSALGDQEQNSDEPGHPSISAQWDLKAESIPFLHGASGTLLENTERKLANFMNENPGNTFLANEEEHGNVSPESFTTVKEVLQDIANDETIKNVCGDLQYIRMPLPRHRIPKFEVFDKVIAIVRDSYEKDPKTAFVCFCHNGKRRTVNMMATACLVLGHIKGFSEDIGNELGDRFEPWVPDVEYTRGEFKVVAELIQILPDCNTRKKEVDYILDTIHESMSTMHYHPRENLNPCFKKVKKAKCFEEFLRLKQQSLQNLEFYAILILFNCYLNQEKGNFWRSLSFDDWIETHASQVGVLDILDNFGYQSLGEDAPLDQMLGRWQATSSLIRDIICIDEMNSFSPRQPVSGAEMSSTSSILGCIEDESI